MAASGKLASAWMCILMKKRKASSGCSTSPAMTLPHWSRSRARAQATSTRVCLFSNSSPLMAEAFTAGAHHRQPRQPASHGFRRRRTSRSLSSNAGGRTGRTKSRTCYPPSIVAAWIQANLYLSLADAPFDREDPTLNSTAGACVTCPRRSGYNTALFADVVSDQCLDSSCYHSKVEAFLDREIAAHPGLVQIENGWRNPKEQRPGAVQRGHVRELDAVIENPDAEPSDAMRSRQNSHRRLRQAA